MQAPACPELCVKPVGVWNRLERGCPFLPKQRFKLNVLNTSCHVIDKDGDINLDHTKLKRKSIRFWRCVSSGTSVANNQLIFLSEASFGLRVLSLPASVCVSVCLCVNHLLVRGITRDPFKLGSPNLDHRCKRPCLRALIFWGVIDLDFQGQI